MSYVRIYSLDEGELMSWSNFATDKTPEKAIRYFQELHPHTPMLGWEISENYYVSRLREEERTERFINDPDNTIHYTPEGQAWRWNHGATLTQPTPGPRKPKPAVPPEIHNDAPDPDDVMDAVRHAVRRMCE